MTSHIERRDFIKQGIAAVGATAGVASKYLSREYRGQWKLNV
jgi:hypothetical protein